MVTWRSRSEITVTPLSLAHAMKAESVLNVWPLYCAWVMGLGLDVFRISLEVLLVLLAARVRLDI